MKFSEINNKFTAIVAEWMAKGYTINTATMSGSQGEIAKVDLTNGTEIIRVMLDKFFGRTERTEGKRYWFDGVRLIVGRAEASVKPNSPSDWYTVWNERLEEISSECFYEIGKENRSREKWYGTKAEAAAQQDLWLERQMAKQEDRTYDLTEIGRDAILPFVRRQPRCKTVKPSEIVKITKKESYSRFNSSVSVRYVVEVRGSSFELH